MQRESRAIHKMARGDLRLRFTLSELGGALGDLGTLLPLAAALITVNGMSSTGVFVTVAAGYLIAGLYFRLPVPVQPLKAAATIAIASGLSGNIVSAAGLVMGVMLLGLAATGLISSVTRLFGRPLIRGIQLGLGLLLIQTGLLLATRPKMVPTGEDSVVRVGDILVPLGLPLAVIVCLALLWRTRSRGLPAILLVIVFGVGVALLAGALNGIGTLRLGLVFPQATLPSMADLGLAFALLVVPQIPLTLANAVVATSRTARDYFGEAARSVTPRALLTSMGLVNVAAGFVGGLPICHGSGGLTAHYRFGARTGGASIMIGALLLVLALVVDGNVVPILALIPYPILGALLTITGIQHGLLMRDVRGQSEISIAAAVATVGFLTGNLAIGAGVGLLVQFVFVTSGHVFRRPQTAP